MCGAIPPPHVFMAWCLVKSTGTSSSLSDLTWTKYRKMAKYLIKAKCFVWSLYRLNQVPAIVFVKLNLGEGQYVEFCVLTLVF
jgi:hypothetical protein